MGPGRSKDWVAAGAALTALVFGAYLFLRAQARIGVAWTDGERRFAAETGSDIRHAVWGAPEALDAGDALGGEAGDPTLSPDGRWLVFATGTRGLNAELYLAELVDGAPRAVEPLAAVNSPADELAPAFGVDAGGWALFFASDRAGGPGGLDLWRAPYADGAFGAPEPLAGGVNSGADDTDPAPLLDGALVFASDRAHGRRTDFELYRAAPSPRDGDVRELEPLEALNGPGDEREPCASPDGRALYFARAPDAAAADFDLWRSVHAERGWLAPEPLAALNTPAAERGPWVSADGFALLFERTTPDDARELLRARSRELFRVPAPPTSLSEWLFLVGLLLLALVALLAKRWGTLELLYKALLTSLVLHLLLLLYLRTVYPEGASFDGGRAAEDGGPTFRVRLAPAESALATRGASGAGAVSAPTRERLQGAGTGPAVPERAELAEPERVAEAAPARDALAAEVATGAEAVRLAEREPAPTRQGGAAPALALGAARAAPRSEGRAGSEPERASPGTAAELGAAAPAAADLVAEAAARADLAAGAPQRGELARAEHERESPGIELAAPAEHFAPSAGTAPALELAAAASGAAPSGADARPDRSVYAGGSRATAAPASPTVAPGALVAPSASAGPIAGPSRAALVAVTDGAVDVTELRAPSERFAPFGSGGSGDSGSGGTGGAAPFDPAAGLVGTALRARAPDPTDGGGPRREARADSSPRAAGPAPAPEAAELGLVAAEGASSAAAPTFERSSAPGAVAAAPATALRAPAAPPRPAAPAGGTPRAFDATQGLSGAEGGSTAVAARQAPSPHLERAALAASAVAPAEAEPELRPLASVAVVAAADEVERGRGARLSQTPYQNRFGEQKLRALEEFGGSTETEHAVAQGLAYLARIQGQNGAWGQRSDAHEKYLDVRIGKTGLALLAFLGAGHVPGGSTEHAAVAEKAVRYLLAAQVEENGHFGQSCSYGHGIATYALAECYALTQDGRLRAPLELALAEILRHQRREADPRFAGGWGYYFADGHVWNGDEWPRTSVTAWQVMALESARLSGLSVPDQAFEGAREFLLNTWDARARAFRYDHDPARLNSGYPILPASTPAALFALSLLGVDAASPELSQARRFVLTRQPDGYRYTGDDDFVEHARGNLYFWYYATLAMFRVGGSAWESWNGALKQTLLPAQDEDGSWRPIDTYAEYAGDEDEERTYTTAMCVLSLEIYYRYFTPLLRVK